MAGAGGVDIGNFGLEDLPQGLELIWHGTNDPKNLELFIKSKIRWAEGDVRGDPEGRLVLRHDSFDSHPPHSGEALLDFRDWLRDLLRAGKSIQIDLKEGGETAERVIRALREHRVPQDRLWLTTNLKDVAMEDYARLGREFPKSPLQSAIPHRFMFQDMDRGERQAWMELNRGLGVRHLAISWYEDPQAHELDEIREAGFGVHFFYVNTLDDFGKAAALKPDSITSDFHIPEWGLYGRGSGENGFYLDGPDESPDKSPDNSKET
jgi:hypothetical protein